MKELLNCIEQNRQERRNNMKHIVISLNIQDENGCFIPIETLDEKQLRQLRFRLLAEAGKIEDRIFELTGKDVDDVDA